MHLIAHGKGMEAVYPGPLQIVPLGVSFIINFIISFPEFSESF